ncbi:DUF3558 domain-containing protein [Mycolicibacterium moriokaense]|nr:DUF3558 domain-containing protein [Mycolicibacterium moriokaense]
MIASRTAIAFAVLAACLTLAGCGDKPQAADTSSAPSASPTPGSVINACTLIGSDDIAKLLGKPIDGRPIGAPPDAPACTWENRDTYESITLEIGNPGTAVDDVLSPPEAGFPDAGAPGPDGMRILASGMVEFAAAGRSNTVQVAVLALTGQAADNAAVDLARKIGPHLPR